MTKISILEFENLENPLLNFYEIWEIELNISLEFGNSENPFWSFFRIFKFEKSIFNFFWNLEIGIGNLEI